MQKHFCIKRPAWIVLKRSNTDPNWPSLQYNVAVIWFLSTLMKTSLWSPAHQFNSCFTWGFVGKKNKQPHIGFRTCKKKIKKNKIPAVHTSVCTCSFLQQPEDDHTLHTQIESRKWCHALHVLFFCFLQLRSMQADLLYPSIHLFKTLDRHLTFRL